MAQTLEQLFRTKIVGASGETAEVKYDVRDSKSIDIKPSNTFTGLLLDNTGFALARSLRKRIGVRTGETLLEQETTGIRVIRAASEPVIYAGELDRITLRSTYLLDTIKSATYSPLSNPDSILAKLTQLRQNVISKIGIPYAVVPSIVASDPRLLQVGETQKRDEVLKDILKSGEGSVLGKFVTTVTTSGNLNNLGNVVVGSLLTLGRGFLRNKLLGNRDSGYIPPGYTDGVSSVQSNPALPSVTTFKTLEYKYAISYNYGSNTQATPNNIPVNNLIDKAGSTYSNTLNINPSAEPGQRFDLSDKQVISLAYNPSDNDTKLNTSLYGLKPRLINDDTLENGQPKENSDELTFSNISEIPNESDSPLFDKLAKNVNNQDSSLSPKRELTIIRNRYSADADRIPKTIISKRQIDTKSDGINRSSVYSDNNNTSTSLAGLDFVPLRFKSIHTGKAANFRATITSLTETYSPSWDTAKFLGSPFNYYTYSTVERGASFDFKVFSLNATEHKNAWDKINFLASLVYPQGYYDNSAIVAPLVEFNLGDMFKNRVCFLDTFALNYEDNTPWQITDSETTADGTTENMKGYRLPMIVSISVGLKFLESRSVTAGKKFYNFSPVN